jgi:WD40 repeat protein
MKRIPWFLLSAVFLCLAGCRPATVPGFTETTQTEYSSPSLPIPVTNTQIPAASQTSDPTATRTRSPFLAPTPDVISRTGTPIPIPTEALGPENIGKIAELVRWETGEVNDLEFSPAGDMLAIATTTGMEFRTLSGDPEDRRSDKRSIEGFVARAVSFADDGKMVGVSWDMKSMGLWKESDDGEMHKILEQEMFLRSLDFSRDGSQFAAGDHSGNITIWNLGSGGVVGRWKGFGNWVDAIAFSPDGGQLAVQYDDNRTMYGGEDMPVEMLQIMDRTTGGRRMVLEASLSSVEELAFSPDGKLLAAEINSDYILFSVRTGQAEAALPNFGGGWLSHILFSPNGRLLATAPSAWFGNNDPEPYIQIWDVNTALEMLRLNPGGDTFAEIAFSPDGRYIASGTHSGIVSVWGVIPSR